MSRISSQAGLAERQGLSTPALCTVIVATAAAATGCDGGATQQPEESLVQQQERAAVAVDSLDDAIDALNRRFGGAFWIAETFPSPDARALRTEVETMIEDAHVRGLSDIEREYPSIAHDTRTSRKLMHLGHRLAYPLPAQRGARVALREQLDELARAFDALRPCYRGQCYSPVDAEQRIRESGDAAEAEALWLDLRRKSASLVSRFRGVRGALNRAAADWGYADMGDWWISRYERPAGGWIAELDLLRDEMEPLSAALRCHISAELGGDARPTLPASHLHSLWGRDWSHLHDRVRGDLPPDRPLQLDVAERFVAVEDMVRWAEGTYRSAGFPALPGSFWEASQFVRPDRDISACPRFGTNVDWFRDVRLTMCGELNTEDLAWSHGMLAFLYYDLAFSGQDWVFRDPPHLGFHFANSGAMKLALTRQFLHREGLLPELPTRDEELSSLLAEALAVVPGTGYGMAVDRWRWEVFSRDMTPEEMSGLWWQLRARYQGVTRPEGDELPDEPFAHAVAARNVELLPRALGDILKFQFLEEACRSAGDDAPLHQCSFYGSDAVAERLWPILERGSSEPWYEVLEAYTGSPRMSAAALLEYFAPLKRWLDGRNAGRC
jgi:peptidyl-dipeptidase A